jgi:hypothetical protein
VSPEVLGTWGPWILGLLGLSGLALGYLARAWISLFSVYGGLCVGAIECLTAYLEHQVGNDYFCFNMHERMILKGIFVRSYNNTVMRSLLLGKP